MSRWSQYDTVCVSLPVHDLDLTPDQDEYRLPEGVRRVGYDSDTGRYQFRDSSGSMWQGPQGAEYGQLTRGSNGSPEDIETAPARADGYQPLATDNNAPLAHRHQVNTNAYRTLLPFFLLIGVFLLMVWKLVFSYGYPTAQDPCHNATSSYMVEPGDYCWKIAFAHNLTLEELERSNPDVKCDALRPGTVVCLPRPVSLETPPA
ncbi:hypothetical protein D9757_004152 [Collybiopsis confluens]|uniref:LysM domain-containing protein n=1 Tax=Collybiopsis confluens TaxID=2823264 RepID=A0A8H5HUW7_9AGAR|nr:hypothetical protein D9757_004152 [Collybiopsis confluens]